MEFGTVDGGNVFVCDIDGKPIIILLLDTDGIEFDIPFMLFMDESMPKPVFPLL